MLNQLILFVSHDASATGAPFLLLHLLRWLRDNSKLHFKMIVGKPGPLLPRFAELGPVGVVNPPFGKFAERVVDFTRSYQLARWVDRSAIVRGYRNVGNEPFALVYSNTLVNGKIIANLRDQRVPVISHVHELEYTIARFDPHNIAYSLQRTRRFIAGSNAVARNLVENHGIDAGRLEVVHEFIPTASAGRRDLASSALRAKSELGISRGAFVAGAAGTVEWRKGCDLFIPLALEVLRSDPHADVHFVWVGNFWDRDTPREIAHDLRKLGLEKRVHFLGHRDHYADYIAAFDVLCLMSREDPFPLVVLEGAAAGKPILAFEMSGGAPEFIEEDSGFVIPYLDVRAMANRLIELMNDRALAAKLGECAKRKVTERHDVAIGAPRILETIERTLHAR